MRLLRIQDEELLSSQSHYTKMLLKKKRQLCHTQQLQGIEQQDENDKENAIGTNFPYECSKCAFYVINFQKKIWRKFRAFCHGFPRQMFEALSRKGANRFLGHLLSRHSYACLYAYKRQAGEGKLSRAFICRL